MKKIFKIGIFVFATIFILSSCVDDVFEVNSANENNTFIVENSLKSQEVVSYCGSSSVFTLFAGQSINAGNLTVVNDQENIYVTYTTTGGWLLIETQLFVGNLANVPLAGQSNPKIGNFPYKAKHSPNVTSFTYVISREGLSESIVIAAHASVVKPGSKQETAWSSGNRFSSKGSWATYSNYELQGCCEVEPVEYDYIGGQNIVTGVLSVTNDNENLYVTFVINGDWYLNATQLYVGSAQSIPVNGSNVPMPGHFPYKVSYPAYVKTYTYIVPLAGLPNTVAIAAHGELRKVVNGVEVGEETGWSFGTSFPNTNRWGWYSNYTIQSGCN
jgi:hypothetical protein